MQQESSAAAASSLKLVGNRLLANYCRGRQAWLSLSEAKAASRAAGVLLVAATQHQAFEERRAYNSWAGSWSELLSLYAIALRQSSRSLHQDQTKDELAAYMQLREGVSSEVHLLCTAAQRVGHVALLRAMGCALLRAGTLQCYTRLLSDAAEQLQPAARAACADLPEDAEVPAAEEKLFMMLGQSREGVRISPGAASAAVSGSLRLASEVVRVLQLLAACKENKVVTGTSQGVWQCVRACGAFAACEQAGAAAGSATSSSSSGGGPCHDAKSSAGQAAFLEALGHASSQGHLAGLHQHAARVLLLATAAARGRDTHQHTHETASQIARQLMEFMWQVSALAVTNKTIDAADGGLLMSELVQLCASLDGGTTYGMAPGLWPRPGGCGADGAGSAASGDPLAAKLLLGVKMRHAIALCSLLGQAEGSGAAQHTRAVRDMFVELKGFADSLLHEWNSINAKLLSPVAEGSEGRAFRRLASQRKAQLAKSAQQCLRSLTATRKEVLLEGAPPRNRAAVLCICLRLARAVLRAQERPGGVAPGALPGGPAGGVGGVQRPRVGAGAAPAGTGGGVGVGAETGATPAAGAGSSEAALQGLVDLFLLQSAVAAARAVLTCDIDASIGGRAGARRLARLRGWWEVVVEAARRGVVAKLNVAHALEPPAQKPLPKHAGADVTAALEVGVLPCCTQLLRHSGVEGGGASSGTGGSFGSGGGKADISASGSSSGSSSTTTIATTTSNGSSSGRTTARPTEADLSQLPAHMQLFLDRSSRLSSLLASFQACSWQQLLAFGVREEVRELTSALAWRLGWQVGQLRGAVEEEAGAGAWRDPASSHSPEAAPAAPGSGAAWHAQEAGEVLLFAGHRLGDMLWLRWQGQGEGGKGDTGRHAAASKAGTSGSGSAAEGGAPCGNGDGEPGRSGGDHTCTCGEQHLEEKTDGGGAGCSGADGGSGSGASGAPGGVGPASAVAGTAASGTAMDYGRAAAELWDEVSELLPAAARGALACAEVVLAGGAGEGGGGDNGGEEGRARDGVGVWGDGSSAGAALDRLGGQLARATWYCCTCALECASLLLLAHVEAEVAGAGRETSPWRGVLLGEVQLAELLGAGVRLWQLVAGGEAKGKDSVRVMLLHLLELAAVAFPAELRAVLQDEGGAAGAAPAGSEGPPAEGSSQPCPQPAPWCHMSLCAVRGALGRGVDGVELQAVCRVAGGWEPEQGERRVLLEEGAGRLVDALWREEREEVEGAAGTS